VARDEPVGEEIDLSPTPFVILDIPRLNLRARLFAASPIQTAPLLPFELMFVPP